MTDLKAFSQDWLLESISLFKGRNVLEVVLLAQQIDFDIRLRSKLDNVVIKLDLDKAYNRVDQNFLIKVHRRLGLILMWQKRFGGFVLISTWN